jgi:hypothetical protein
MDSAKHKGMENVCTVGADPGLCVSGPKAFKSSRKGPKMGKEKHIGILGMLHITWGALVLFIGLMGFVFFTGIGVLSGDATAMGILGLLGTLAAIFMGVVALPGILAGVGLLRRREWGRILALVVGFISIIDIPFGTALGIYTIWVLLDDGIKGAFSSGATVNVSAPQQAPLI